MTALEIKKFTIDCSQPLRADLHLAKLLGLSRSATAHLLEQNCVLCAGKPVNKNDKLHLGQEITVTLPDATPATAVAQAIPLDIVYEDDCLLIVNKPKGMVVHPAPGNPDGTLVNALLAHCGSSLSGINGVMRPGILHRIDKDTSGLLLVAKNDFAHAFLAEQIQAHTFTRTYEAVVYGRVKADGGTIDAPIGRHPVRRKEMAVTEKNSKPAVTHYRVVDRYEQFTHLSLNLETGRTHQIRVHMAYIGHPVAGDPVYGPKKVIKTLQGQCLHAKQIGFIHPVSKEYMLFDSTLPDYFTAFLNTLGEKDKHGNI